MVSIEQKNPQQLLFTQLAFDSVFIITCTLQFSLVDATVFRGSSQLQTLSD